MDAIVNTANAQPVYGSGTDRAIICMFRANQPIQANWKARIDEDYKNRGGKR